MLHIVWVVADDLGYADVPFTRLSGSEVLAPRLLDLAKSGLILDNYYVQPICTPTRAAFMTGRHPVQLGLQHGVVHDSVPDAVPSDETMLPELLRLVGYSTHLVGKWHLGFHQPMYTPERRGFDTHFGYYTGNTEYYNHTSPCWGCGNYTAVDLHRANASHWAPVLDRVDEYSTHLFAAEAVERIETHAAAHGATARSRPLFLVAAFEAVHGASSCYRHGAPPDCEYPDDDELQVPSEYEAAQSHISRRNRRRYAGMVGALDEAVGNMSDALERSGLRSRTLLLFSTDNGAPFRWASRRGLASLARHPPPRRAIDARSLAPLRRHLGGDTMSNFPLRGGKGELWEGGVRGAAFVAGGALPPQAAGRRTSALVAAADWLPTLLSLAGAAPPPSLRARLYGVDVSAAIVAPGSVGDYQLRPELLHNIDDLTGKASAHSCRPVRTARGAAHACPHGQPLAATDRRATAARTPQAALRVGDLKLVRGEAASAWGPDPRLGAPAAAAPLAAGPKWSDETGYRRCRRALGAVARYFGWSRPPDRLFDVVADPREQHDLAADGRYAARLASMQQRLDEVQRLVVPSRQLAPDAAARPRAMRGLTRCTPSPVGPILCAELGVWRPWQADGPTAADPTPATFAGVRGSLPCVGGGALGAALLLGLHAACRRLRRCQARTRDLRASTRSLRRAPEHEGLVRVHDAESAADGFARTPAGAP